MLFSTNLIEMSPSVLIMLSNQTKRIHGEIYYLDLYMYKLH